jgi:ATP-dependent Clp protease ATP-binding subunit ClpA
MRIDQLLRTASQKYGDDPKAFYAYIALELVNTFEIFDLLEQKSLLKKDLAKYIPESTRRSGIGGFGARKIGEPPHVTLKNLSMSHQSMLGCLREDEHVLLLASLKGLDLQTGFGYYKTVLKEMLSKNLHRVENFELETPLVGRTKEIGEIQRILFRNNRNNVLIVGPTGVGKTFLAKAMRQYLHEGKMYQLFAGNNSLLDSVVSIISSNHGSKPIFLLDELFTFETNHIKYIIDNARIISTANESVYRKFMVDYPHIFSKFEVLQLEEVPLDDLNRILTFHCQLLTQTRQVEWEPDILDEVVKLSKQFLQETAFPSKSISVLEEAAFYARQQQLHCLTKDMLRVIISQRTNIPIGSLTDIEKRDLTNLEFNLKSRVKGQDQAVAKVAQTIQRSRLGFGNPSRPIGSFMFVGPSGVGKTELAKSIARELFGDEEAMVRLDMSEFAEAHMVQRLIGSPPGYVGYEDGGQLTNPVRQKPYTLVLLDEIEKAHPRVFDIFLQVLDDGRLTDGQGKKVDFTHTVIVATSNAGNEDVLDMISEGRSRQEIQAELKEILQDYFRIEFINRFNEIIIFDPLTPDALFEIARNHFVKFQGELAMKGVQFSISDFTIAQIAQAAYDPKYGARGLQRLIQERIENPITEKLLSGELQPGSAIEF